jgi:putative acetyltransferase
MSFVTIAQEPADSADAAELIGELDAVLTPLYPQESRHGYSVQKILDKGVAFFVARIDGQPAACGGVLLVGDEYAEIKRMYVRPAFRGSGVGARILGHLINHARQRGIRLLRLETGTYQVEAIRLYQRAGFQPIPPFGPYRADPLSLCFEKQLR